MERKSSSNREQGKNSPARRGAVRAASRRTIWQINHSYHCSVVGICLNRADLRLLAKKKIFALKASDSDYDIHRALSGAGEERSQANRQLTKYLDGRHTTSIKRYAHCADAGEILAMWRQNCQDGDVAGAYWAVLTHPQTDAVTAAAVYGESHMLSFDGFAEGRKTSEALARAMEENKRLRAEASALRDGLKQSQSVRLMLEGRLRHEEERLDFLSLRLAEINALKDRLMARLASDGAVAGGVAGPLKAAQERMSEIGDLRGRLAARERQLADSDQLLRQAERERLALLARCETADSQDRELRREIETLEEMLTARAEADCGDCSKEQRQSCQLNGLCGKTVLYVGGRANMVPHYRQLIEKQGGAFLHHDGGLENSRQLLPKLLCGADAVLCPVDCVSHDACRSVKKMCKQYQKQFVPMRSSGLSSLVKSLEAIQ